MAFDSKLMSAFAWMFVLVTSIRAQDPQPKLAGRVTQVDSGSPVEGATVTLLPPYIAGQLNLQRAKTDSNGNYRFEKVVDGTYSITASADGFVPQDYKRDASPEGAFVRIDSATIIRGIDFQLTPEAVIRGTVVDVTGTPVTDLLVAAVRQDWKITPLHGAVFARMKQADGSYVIPDIPAGHYTLVSTAWLRVQPVGQQIFDVLNADVTLRVQLGGLGEIVGTVQWAGAPAAPSGRALFMIESEEGAAQGVRVDGQGHFDISGVLPGKYRFKPFQIEPVAIPRSVQCTGKKVDNESPLQVDDREKVLDCRVMLEKPDVKGFAWMRYMLTRRVCRRD